MSKERCKRCHGKLPYRGGLIPVLPCECGNCACETCVAWRKDPEGEAAKPQTMGGVILPGGTPTPGA